MITTNQLSREIGISQRGIQLRLRLLGIQPARAGRAFVLTASEAQRVRTMDTSGRKPDPNGSTVLARKLGVSRQRADQMINPAKLRARQAVAYALKSGKLAKADICSSCSSNYIIEAHHADYSKPLDITWLCRKCHKKAHGVKVNS